MQDIITILSLLAFSATKFFLAVPAAVVAGYDILTCILITSGGGIAGFFLFFYIGEMKWIRYYFGKFMDFIFRILGIERVQKEKKKFTRMNRFIVTVRGKYGIIGLAALTPVLFSIPLGSLIAARYYDKNKLTIPLMVVFILVWSILLSVFYKLFS